MGTNNKDVTMLTTLMAREPKMFFLTMAVLSEPPINTFFIVLILIANRHSLYLNSYQNSFPVIVIFVAK